MSNFKTSSLDQIKNVMQDRYQGNAGVIINGFVEMGLKGEKLKAALIRYIERVPRY
jgi:hypothetical protein